MENSTDKKRQIIQAMLFSIVGIIASVCFMYYCAPRSATDYMDVYTGQRWTVHEIFGFKFNISKPQEEHTAWAIKNLEVKPANNFIDTGTLVRGEWFGADAVDGLVVDPVSGVGTVIQPIPVTSNGRGSEYDIPYYIYKSEFPKKKKIELLHEYHDEIVMGKRPFWNSCLSGYVGVRQSNSPDFEKWNKLLEIHPVNEAKVNIFEAEF